MLENTRKYFQGIPTDAAAAAAAAAQFGLPPLSTHHHLHLNGGSSGKTAAVVMSSGGGGSGSSSEPPSPATDRFVAYHHQPHLRYSYQPYSSPGHYPRTAVDPKPAAYQHHHFQPPAPPLYPPPQQHQPPAAASSTPSSSSSSAAASSSSSPSSSPYKPSPYQLPPAVTMKQLQSSPFKLTARTPPPNLYNGGKHFTPPKSSSPLSAYAALPKSSSYTTVPKPPQSPFAAVSKEKHSAGPQPPETTPYFNRTPPTSSSHAGQPQPPSLDRDFLRFKPIQTPPSPPHR